MRQDRKIARMAQIEDAAYALIRENGYAGTSMLNIAKRAKASNETLYSWYGDKLGLFRAMVANNAIQIRETLEAALTQETSAIETLLLVGPALLRMLTGDRAVALNQAAAADPSGNLGKALAQTGRDSVAPLICQTLERARHTGALSFDDPQTATDLYLGLLIGDLQLRRVTGQTHAPDTQQINQRAKRAVEILLQVFAP